jgi:predicted hydrocarbon binding protein
VSGAVNGGEIDMPHPYVDEGWLKKWGKYKEPVNFIGSGYLSGMFSAVFDKPTRTYNVTETQSVVMGAEKSHFKVTL